MSMKMLKYIGLSVLLSALGCGDRLLVGKSPDGTSESYVGEVTPSELSPEQAQQQLMTRWNAAVDANPQLDDFHWTVFDQFTHPTFKMGSDRAYIGFATILVAFLENEDNFAFLGQSRMFDTRLVYVFSSGQKGVDTSFRQLANDFSANDVIPADTRARLKAAADRM